MLDIAELKKCRRIFKRLPTEYEKLLEHKLTVTGIDFKKQMILGFYVLDFVLPDKMIVIELDGYVHRNRQSYDKYRDDFIRSCGFKVLRIPNSDVKHLNVVQFRTYPDYPVSTFRSGLGKANSLRSKAIQKQRRKE